VPERTVSVKSTMTEKEAQMVDSLGDYLKEEGKINRNSRSEVVRYAIRTLGNVIMSRIEQRRYGGKRYG